MEIRRLKYPDLDHYFALRLEMLKNSPDAFLVTFEEEKARGPSFFAGILEREHPDSALFGGFIEGKLAGAAGVYREEHRLKTAHKAILWGMYVQPSARGVGLGEALVAGAIGHARGVMGAGALFLGVESGNKKAQALYKRMGFRVWGTEPKAYRIDGSYRTENHMWLDLDG